MDNSEISDTIDAALHALRVGLHTGLPARVDAYDRDTQSATVTPMLRRRFQGGTESGMSPITNVPVIFPRGGGYAMVWDLSAGDIVWLAFGERSLREWLSGDGGEVTPSAVHRHALTDAVAFAGIAPNNAAAAIGIAEAGKLVIGSENGDVAIKVNKSGNVTVIADQVVVESDDVRLGSSSASDPVARTSYVDARIASIVAAHDGHTHTDPVSGITGLPSLLLGSQATVAATKVKAE